MSNIILTVLYIIVMGLVAFSTCMTLMFFFEACEKIDAIYTHLGLDKDEEGK